MKKVESARAAFERPLLSKRGKGTICSSKLIKKSPLRAFSAISTFEATVLARRISARLTMITALTGNSSCATVPGCKQETDFNSTISPYKENYADIRAKLNAELAEAEAVESIQIDEAVAHRPVPPPPEEEEELPASMPSLWTRR